ncbi:MAG: ATP-binding protein [Sedimentisphaerales bacterium]|jgi:light-regulated signal transduction histidine kinase (bacteriophytochrome)
MAISNNTTAPEKTEESQAQQLEKLKSIEQEFKDFAYIISHDLKAPLRGIKALADWIATDYADKFDEDGKEQLKLLTSRVNRMHNLLEGVLQYSRIGRITENKTPIDLNQFVPEIIEALAPPANIHITIENQLPVIVSEPTRIRQVFQNLLDNAVKVMNKPEGFIKVGCTEENGYWKFSVSDNGPGIEEQHFERIFKIFQTLQPKDQVESTGVGLTIAKKIVELYGGRIWLTSRASQGSTFFFTLPKQPAAIQKTPQMVAS